MSQQAAVPGTAEQLEERAARLFFQHQESVWRRADRLFAWLMVGQWLAAIAIAALVAHDGWLGKAREVHLQTAVFLGGALSAVPIVLVWLRPGTALTRHGVAICQL